MFWKFCGFMDLDPDPDWSNFVNPDPEPDTINPDPHHWLYSSNLKTRNFFSRVLHWEGIIRKNPYPVQYRLILHSMFVIIPPSNISTDFAHHDLRVLLYNLYLKLVDIINPGIPGSRPRTLYSPVPPAPAQSPPSTLRTQHSRYLDISSGSLETK